MSIFVRSQMSESALIAALSSCCCRDGQGRSGVSDALACRLPVRIDRTAAFERSAGRFVCADRVASCGRGNFRSDELLGHATNTGNRNSSRSWRPTLRCASSRHCCRGCVLSVPVFCSVWSACLPAPIASESAFRHRRDRSADDVCRHVDSNRRGVLRLLPAGTAGYHGRSSHCLTQ